MRHLGLVAAMMFGAACGHGNEPAKSSGGSAVVGPPIRPAVAAARPTEGSAAVAAVAARPEPEPPPAIAPAPVPANEPPPVAGHDFTPTGLALVAVGACGEASVPDGFSKDLIAKHCGAIKTFQGEYAKRWVTPARAFFAEKVPAEVPKKVVYPFAGGDLSTALTVYPDADEITTMSLEPAGDPRTLAALAPGAGEGGKRSAKAPASTPSAALAKALGTIRYELNFLYKVNFSNTMNMIDAMRGGALPTQLVFGLSALQVHGFEVVALRYFKLDDAGVIVYLTDEDVAQAPDPSTSKPDARNRIFANAEIRFRRPGGRVQIYRHIQVNLDNDHLKKDPRVLAHLEQKGPVAGMTKAASYLLSWSGFSTIRGYLTSHVVWMVSDATGVPPRYGKAAGYEYEMYGAFTLPHIDAGEQISKEWSAEWAAQPKRALKFRFGYYDGSPQHTNHLVIMRKKA